MTERTSLYLSFPDAETAKAAILPLFGIFDPPLESIPSDGWIDGVYVNFDVLFGTGSLPNVAGCHVNAIWNGPEETIPEALQTARVYPNSPSCVFG